MRHYRLLLPILSLGLTAPAHAEVGEAAPLGFVVSGEVTVAAEPAAVWAALVEPAKWWNSQHSWSGDAANLTLDPRAGGCFCEKLPGGGSVEHMRVIYAAPGEMLRLSGALGPLQGQALSGTLTIELAAEADGTHIKWISVVGGFAAFDDAEIPAAVDYVIGEQMGRLSALLGPAG